MKLVLDNAKDFKKSIEAISVLIDEAEFVISKNGLSLKATDPSQISMVDFELKKEAFRKYSEEATIIFKKLSVEGIHLGDVKLVENEWILAGRSGYALIVTGSGSTMEEARKQAYQRVKNIILPNMFYRTDIGLKWNQDSDRLQTWGYLY